MLSDKIKTIYPSLIDSDFAPITGTITLQNDGDGDYIAKWEHPTLAKPTNDQLK
jgi:hypothetical protein